ncbi:hypothetical protein TeGR_g14989 [Tetraparma gracilis]|uniref:Uncharacterized protein n=1 Tax=Tetraparma gracilis TaxID=2962635 RepID=A0ABQ6N7G8_9STRA|nr:hypothetical protein TeGR_g14989 [Tetraparma gracilis]
MSSAFTLTLSVPPETPVTAAIHIYAFAMGLLGYSIMKIFGTLEYYAFHPDATFQTMSTKHKLYVVFEVLQCVIFVAMALALGGLTATLDLEEVFARDVPENIQFDWLGNFLVLVAAVGPVVVWKCAPEARSVRIIDDD